MFLIVIVIVIFSLKFINYFINNINYKKKYIFLKQIIIFRILGSKNLGSWWRTQQNWVLTHDSLILGFDNRLISLGSSTMSQASGVLKWRADMVPAQHNPNTIYTQGCAQHGGRTQAPREYYTTNYNYIRCQKIPFPFFYFVFFS
jgi:hypothetical protein